MKTIRCDHCGGEVDQKEKPRLMEIRVTTSAYVERREYQFHEMEDCARVGMKDIERAIFEAADNYITRNLRGS